MGNIHHLPIPARAPLPMAAPHLFAVPELPQLPTMNVAARRYVTVAEAATKLAMEDATPRTIIDRLRALYEHCGLPDPENHRFIKGVPCIGAQRIHAASRWDRGRFLAWLDNGDGGHAAAVPQGTPAPSANSVTRQRLADNAAALIGRERRRA